MSWASWGSAWASAWGRAWGYVADALARLVGPGEVVSTDASPDVEVDASRSVVAAPERVEPVAEANGATGATAYSLHCSAEVVRASGGAIDVASLPVVVTASLSVGAET